MIDYSAFILFISFVFPFTAMIKSEDLNFLFFIPFYVLSGEFVFSLASFIWLELSMNETSTFFQRGFGLVVVILAACFLYQSLNNYNKNSVDQKNKYYIKYKIIPFWLFLLSLSIIATPLADFVYKDEKNSVRFKILMNGYSFSMEKIKNLQCKGRTNNNWFECYFEFDSKDFKEIISGHNLKINNKKSLDLYKDLVEVSNLIVDDFFTIEEKWANSSQGSMGGEKVVLFVNRLKSKALMRYDKHNWVHSL